MLRRQSHSRNYYSKHGNELRSRRALSNKIHTVKNLVLKAGIVILFVGIIYVILFSPVLAVKNVIVEGNKVINSGEINNLVMSQASQKKWKIFNNNILLISTNDLESAIKDRFGNIDTIKIEKNFPKTIKIVIKEKPADISWCNKIRVGKAANEINAAGEEVLPSDILQCYLSDENGLIYEKIGDNPVGNSVKVFRDEPIAIGFKIGDENLKNFIRNIFYNFNNKTGLSLNYLYILPAASRELHLVTGNNWKIYFDLNRGADEQISVLNAFLKNELKNNDNKAVDYDYIDLRVVDRVYYKAKGLPRTNS